MKNPLITAHAGCENTVPNSESSLRAALSLHPDAVEVDVRRNGDGTLVLSHNPIGASGIDCTLERALDLVKAAPEIQINCDLKEPGLEEAVLELARSRDALDRVILTGTVRPEAVKALQKSLLVYLNLECLIPERDFAAYRGPLLSGRELDLLFRRAEQYGVGVINLSYQLCSEELQERAWEKGMGLSVWTVDDPALLEKLIPLGFRNVTTRTVRTALRLRDGFQPAQKKEEKR